MSKAKLKCPRCHSKKLYKFGKDKNGNQKYQCTNCKRQFAPTAITKERKLANYPRCPLCGKATYIHHDYPKYTRYKCGNRKCNHVLVQAKASAVIPSSHHLIDGKNNFKGMRYPISVILNALTLYFHNDSSTRRIAQYLKLTMNIKVSHVTIASWTKKFAPIFKKIYGNILSSINLSDSDEWHADETVVFINGKKHYLWLVIDSETRLILSYHLTPSRDSDQAYSVLNDSKNQGTPKSIVSDRLPSYNEAVKTIFPNSNHIKVQSYHDDITNNLIESFNKSFKYWYKRKKGFNSFKSANTLIFMFIFYYNFIRPHSSLSNLSPVEVAGINFNIIEKSSWLLAA